MIQNVWGKMFLFLFIVTKSAVAISDVEIVLSAKQAIQPFRKFVNVESGLPVPKEFQVEYAPDLSDFETALLDNTLYIPKLSSKLIKIMNLALRHEFSHLVYFLNSKISQTLEKKWGEQLPSKRPLIFWVNVSFSEFFSDLLPTLFSNDPNLFKETVHVYGSEVLADRRIFSEDNVSKATADFPRPDGPDQKNNLHECLLEVRPEVWRALNNFRTFDKTGRNDDLIRAEFARRMFNLTYHTLSALYERFPDHIITVKGKVRKLTQRNWRNSNTGFLDNLRCDSLNSQLIQSIRHAFPDVFNANLTNQL